MSRLDRLVVLLDTGSTQFIRFTAADQLADLAKSHPEENLNLLSRIYPFLRSKKWETRIAAARAVGGIVSHGKKWDPNADDADVRQIGGEIDGKKGKIEGKPAIGSSPNSPGHVKMDIDEPASTVKQESTEQTTSAIKKEEVADSSDEKAVLSMLEPEEDVLLTFKTFDIVEILKNGRKLVSSGGSEFDVDLNSLDPRERLKRQRNSLNCKLGLASEFLPVGDELINEGDVSNLSGNPTGNSSRKSVDLHNDSALPGSATPTVRPISSQKLQGAPQNNASNASSAQEKSTASSARLRAMARRKAKAGLKNPTGKLKAADITQSSVAVRLEEQGKLAAASSTPEGTPDSEVTITEQADANKIVVEHKVPEINHLISLNSRIQGLIWPYQGIYELLLVDLFDNSWEVRHGAAIGLREIIRYHGAGAGRIKGRSRAENNRTNKLQLEDLACRICSLFALDRFGDYVSDQVVAPVRESSGQTLGALLMHLEEDTIVKIFHVLKQLVMQTDAESPGAPTRVWEACHGGMLGLRYLVSVRNDVLFSNSDILDGTIAMVLHGLQQVDDDVQAMGAATLIPIANEIVELRPHTVPGIVSTLWACLSELRDDLSASIGNIMDLLAKLCAHPQVLHQMEKDAMQSSANSFARLVPKLYPFLRHSILNVRKAVLRALIGFLDADDSSAKDSGIKDWIDGKAMRLIFQNLLVEQNQAVLDMSLELFLKILDAIRADTVKWNINSIFADHILPVLNLIYTPIGVARHCYRMKPNMLLRPSGSLYSDKFSAEAPETDANSVKKRKQSVPDKETSDIQPSEERVNIDGPMIMGDLTLIDVEVFIRTKVAGAQALGRVLAMWDAESANSQSVFRSVLKRIYQQLNGQFATGRLVSALILEEYGTSLAKFEKIAPQEVKDMFLPAMAEVLASPDTHLPSYKELVPFLRALRTQCQSLFTTFVEVGKLAQHKLPQMAVVVQGEVEAGPDAFSIDQGEKIATVTFEKLKASIPTIYRMSGAQAFEESRSRVVTAIEDAKEAQSGRTTSILAATASAYVRVGGVPAKLNPVIRSLMESIKLEKDQTLQMRSAAAVSYLVKTFVSMGKRGAADKMVKNLAAFVCVDTSEVPEFEPNREFRDIILSLRKEEAKTDPLDIIQYEKQVAAAKIKRRGSKWALEQISDEFGDKLFDELPRFRDHVIEPLRQLRKLTAESTADLVKDVKKGQEIIDAMGIIRALLPRWNPKLHAYVMEQVDSLVAALFSEYSVFRYSAAKCIATMCSVLRSAAIALVVENVLPSVSNPSSVRHRQGAIECVYHLASTMGADILPYVVFLIVPVLGRMSDSDNDVRILATTTFASLIKLVPLESGIPDPADMPPKLLEGRDREREFISQMMDVSKVKPFKLPVAIRADLRKYQQEGVNWLAFLNKYHLHGILCDDMGLGKTLQTICIVASDHYLRDQEHQRTGSIESRKLPSLIVCPSTLTGHWEQELQQYAPFLKVLAYVGNPSVRASLRERFEEFDVVVTSYDICRNDVEVVSAQDYNYCVLDEGHIIKNSSSKLTKCVKRISAQHRLILTGTPIQNNVVELWSLFDFLMPGFLGGESLFQDKFAKPIAASRNSKNTSKEQEAGALALEALHKQVLPFMLRRLKEDVLSDLPPKIIQDYYCELSDLQKKLYGEFARKQKTAVANELTEGKKEGKQHVFQALQYMRKLCNHPALVVTPKHPRYEEIIRYMRGSKQELRDVRHAPKLQALRTLLLECGIGTSDIKESSKSNNQVIGSNEVISQHRALIFCQLKDMLDMIENDLFKKLMPSVTYMRLDGSTDPRDRQGVVTTFNSDPSIDVLLLTTKVGGLGLNLTGADTVIFVEHDWNPMNDLQAMDRAHRIGQKKVVNVYRLITKGTLEEKIMGLQKFKMNIAATVVNQQNAGLASMDTDQLLDLFNVSSESNEQAAALEADTEEKQKPEDDANSAVAKALGGKAASAMGELNDLWDESQYDDEYNLDAFIQSLR